MKKIILGLVVFLTINLSGCSFLNNYEGDPLMILPKDVDSYRYVHNIGTETTFYKNEVNQFKIVSKNSTSYSFEDTLHSYSIYQTLDLNYVCLEDTFENALYTDDPYQTVYNFVTNGDYEFKQVGISNKFKHSGESYIINLYVDEEMDVESVSVHNKETNKLLFSVSHLNNTVFTIPEVEKMTVPEFVMDNFSDVDYSYIYPIVQVDIGDIRMKYDYSLDKTSLHIEAREYIYVDDTFNKSDEVLALSELELLQTETSLTSETLSTLLDIIDKLANYQEFLD